MAKRRLGCVWLRLLVRRLLLLLFPGTSTQRWDYHPYTAMVVCWDSANCHCFATSDPRKVIVVIIVFVIVFVASIIPCCWNFCVPKMWQQSRTESQALGSKEEASQAAAQVGRCGFEAVGLGSTGVYLPEKVMGNKKEPQMEGQFPTYILGHCIHIHTYFM